MLHCQSYRHTHGRHGDPALSGRCGSRHVGPMQIQLVDCSQLLPQLPVVTRLSRRLK
jgi:hypothetical protein